MGAEGWEEREEGVTREDAVVAVDCREGVTRKGRVRGRQLVAIAGEREEGRGRRGRR